MMVTWKKVVILFCGLFETLIFSGNVLGWTALSYMLKKEGVYLEVCSSETSSDDVFLDKKIEVTSSSQVVDHVSSKNLNFNQTQGQEGSTINVTYPEVANETISGCLAQDRILNLAYTIGSFCIGFSAVISGFLLEKWGLRNTRLITNAFLTSGLVMLAFTTKDHSFLIFPALVLMCLAGVPLRIANIQIANLFPKARSTVITFYSGAFCASASLFVFLKYGYEAGFAWETLCLVLVGFSVVLLPVTLFLLPKDKIHDATTKKPTAPNLNRSSRKCEVSTVTLEKFAYIGPTPTQPYNTRCREAAELPFKASLLSFSFQLHQFWFSWLLLYTILYVGTLNLWLAKIPGAVTEVSHVTTVYGLTQIAALVLAPISGSFMDICLSSASKEKDPETKKLLMIKAGFWPMLITTLIQAAVQVLKLFNSWIAVYASIGIITILRSLLIAVGTAFLHIRYPASHFFRMLGILSTNSALFILLQFPLFIWESRSEKDAVYVNIFEFFCLMVAFLNPLHLLVNPLQRYFIRKENEALKELQQQI
ncbi:equilibrative nucleobase transporter 1-like isoform X2 [Tachypleus tridentatus]|uniref:equilibrative nucleobase transporter 1-like isoform X2 n=1 Tax=Tachypleus tridentatus TaxID=6853 RepID=UPI003FD056D3